MKKKKKYTWVICVATVLVLFLSLFLSSCNSAKAINERGVRQYRRQNYEAAIKEFNKALQENPNFVEAYYNRGSAFFALGDFDRAIADYSMAIQLDHNFVLAYFSRASAHFNKRNFDRAIADWEELLRINPTDRQTIQWLQTARQMRNQ